VYSCTSKVIELVIKSCSYFTLYASCHILPMKSMRRALVSARVLEQVFLVVVLRGVPVLRGGDLSDNLSPLRVEMLRLDLGSNTLGNLLLFRRMVKDSRSVL
jgi:hypothetical protein